MRVLSSLFFSILLTASITIHAAAATITPEYAEIEFSALTIAPEKYDKKKVIFTEEYRNYSSTFPSYMDRSGLSSKKHILLSIGEIRIPSVCSKTDAMIKFISELERGSSVKVYGKVRKFRATPGVRADGMAPEYYIEVEKIELVAPPKKEEPGFDPGRMNDKEKHEAMKEKIEEWKDKHRGPPPFKR